MYLNRLRHRCHEPPYLSSLFLLSFRRNFVEARVKWVRDPYLDAAVEREKNLTPALSLKNLILASSSSSLPISIASAHKPISNFKFILRYPTLFKVFRPRGPSLSPPHVKLTRPFLTLHREEQAIRDSMDEKELAAQRFPMSFSPGFDLQKKVKDWTEMWQSLPYISPYENAFHLIPSSDQMEKWSVAVLHELLSILVSKKTEIKNIFNLGDYLGFGPRFKKALVHFPGIFYVSNKIRTQTVVLREAYRKDVLLVKHPLMGMRHRYIYLMSKSKKLRKQMKKEPVSHQIL